MRLCSSMVGEHARMLTQFANVAVRSSASAIGSPSRVSGYLSISSASTTRTGRRARLSGEPAPASARNPPGKLLNVSVSSALRIRRVPIRSRGTGVTRTIGAIRSLLNCNAASSFGCSSNTGHGSRCAKKPMTFSSSDVLSSGVATITEIVCTPGSVTASMGPRATSTVTVRHFPAVLPASRAR
jgi:hypothetical protein